jgi:2-keto-3-deoxy-6-phosphogluconate aldolase
MSENGQWFAVIVKHKTLEEAVKLARRLENEGVKEITLDSSEWQDEKEEEGDL